MFFHHEGILLDGEITNHCEVPGSRLHLYLQRSEQKYSPRMTYLGFQYVGVSGIPCG